MNIKYSFFNFLKLTIPTVILSLPAATFAEEISLYDQPKTDAKAIRTIDLSAGIIPIYTPKDSGWVKIADPKNGDVGWVKSSDVNSASTSQSIFTFTQSVDNKTPTTYRIMQFGQPTNLTPEQSKALVKQMQKEQQEMRDSMQSMMRNMDRMFYNDWHFMQSNAFPFIVPIMIMPVQKTNQKPHVNMQTVSPEATSTKNNVGDKSKK